MTGQNSILYFCVLLAALCLPSAARAQAQIGSVIEARGTWQLAYEKGMYILTASQSYQAALEVSRLGHGLLTYALLTGLQNARADLNSDGSATARELFNYATEQVPQLQQEEIKKSDADLSRGTGRRRPGKPPVAEWGNENPATQKFSVQRPRVFFRRELEARPLIMARQ